ncbi:unnamed protein product [Bursaphelenchus okinawaensis]|uniref:Fibrinogen C-terminal domain-containing protein n=1 Tax=Bursaphelenchus okinawaensis TaxID=465554 RepID=A0A811K6I9_9BILA|nr:unnamed protein product [Bursaphelenchus okinawaensis]CAG9093246.1 unnamed protein product [Bursaphelenchus okinawaensis]
MSLLVISKIFTFFSILSTVVSHKDTLTCQDLYKTRNISSAIYEIKTRSGPKWAYCDSDQRGGGWTIIQQRNGMTGEPFWNRTWDEFKHGFGAVHPLGEYWLGNDILHDITTRGQKPALLRIEIFGDRTPGSDWNDVYLVAEYDIKVDNETMNYQLDITAKRPKKESNITVDHEYFVGNASFGWYDITTSKKAPFSTIDRINDPLPKCITKFHFGGWWSQNCATVSLNGEYEPEQFGGGYGMSWLYSGKRFIHPRMTRMMIRQLWDDFDINNDI